MSGYSCCRAIIGGYMASKKIDLQIGERFVDETSLTYFHARKVYQEDDRLSTFYSNIRSLNIQYSFREIEEHIAQYDTEGWIILGDDDKALYNYLVLSDSQYQVIGVFSESDIFSSVNTLRMNEEDVIKTVKRNNYAVVIMEKDLTKYENLLSQIENHNKYVVQDHIVGRCGLQYFDYFSPKDKEVFIDGGSLDGRTLDEFVRWCKGEYECAYAFEPNPKMIEICKKHFGGNNKVIFSECALWKEQTNLAFDNRNAKWDAHVSATGNVIVLGNSIDNILGERSVTFIKLDVEGSEMEALQGARFCIQKHVPRMAISIYHKPEDMEEICEFLLKIVPDYKFAVRHYHSDAIETILYVFKE